MADRLERVVDPAAHERAHGGARIAVRGVDGVGGAARARQRELRGVTIDGDDPARAGHTRRGDDLLADPAAADDAYALADPPPRGVAPRAEAGDDGAAEQRRLPEGQLRCDPDGARGGDDAALREA